MRRRFVIAIVPLLALLILAILIPAAIALANRHSSQLVGDRLLDATRFTAIAQPALAGDITRLEAELDSYSELYDTPIWLVDRERAVIHSAGTSGPPPRDAGPLIASALQGSQELSTDFLLPTGPDHLTLVAPVGHDSQVSAALVMEVPTDQAREKIGRDWTLLAAAALIPASLMIGLLWPVSRWLLRPVEALTGSMQRIRAGDVSARADERSGPPELRDLARSFNTMADRVDTTLSRQQQFVFDASHQLRNPIAAVKIAVENLEPDPDADAEDLEAYREAQQTVSRVEAVVTDLLEATAFTPDPAARRPISTAEVDTAEWRALAERAGGEISIDLEAARIAEPTGGLEILVAEAIDNAFRLGRAALITITGRTVDGDYLLAIADDGRGLPPEELSLLGTRFWRSAANQNIPGTGLGLSIVRQCAEDVGGSLDFAAAEAGGLEVTVRLPLAEAP